MLIPFYMVGKVYCNSFGKQREQINNNKVLKWMRICTCKIGEAYEKGINLFIK